MGGILMLKSLSKMLAMSILCCTVYRTEFTEVYDGYMEDASEIITKTIKESTKFNPIKGFIKAIRDGMDSGGEYKYVIRNIESIIHNGRIRSYFKIAADIVADEIEIFKTRLKSAEDKVDGADRELKVQTAMMYGYLEEIEFRTRMIRELLIRMTDAKVSYQGIPGINEIIQELNDDDVGIEPRWLTERAEKQKIAADIAEAKRVAALRAAREDS
jgi:hypothetical protein